MDSNRSNLHLFFVPLWHDNSIHIMIEIARRLAECDSSSGNIPSITFLLVKPPHAELEPIPTFEYIKTLHMEFIHLGPVQFPTRFSPPDDFITNYVRLHLPVVKLAIETMKKGRVVLVLDYLADLLTEIGNDLKIQSYIVYPFNLASLSFMLNISVIDKQRAQEPTGNDPLIDYIPGISPIQLSSLPAPTIWLKKSRTKYISWQCHVPRYMKSNGIIINSSVVLEKHVLKAIEDDQCAQGVPGPTIYPIGPIRWTNNEELQKHRCIAWLDSQNQKSVLFVCFGSRGVFKKPQIEDIAKGLKHSAQPFLWFIQPPDTVSHSPANANVDELLPDRFLSRPLHKGMVCTGWFPPKVILAHPAVGGFMTHCAWDVIQESIWFGVPMIAWPLCREKRLIAFMIKEIGVAVDLKLDVNLHVTASELARAISCLMPYSVEGNRLRAKTEELKNELQRAMEIAGTSYSYLHMLFCNFRNEVIINGVQR